MKNVVSLSLLTVVALGLSFPAVMAQPSNSAMGFAPASGNGSTYAGSTGSTSDAVSGQTGMSGAAFSNVKQPEWDNYVHDDAKFLIQPPGAGLTSKTKGNTSLQSNLVQPKTGMGLLAPNSVSNKDFHDSYNLGFKALGSQLQVNPTNTNIFGPALLPANGTGSVKLDITNGYF